MDKFVVTRRRTPYVHNPYPESYVVEASSEDDAIRIVKDATRDLWDSPFVYKVTAYQPPPPGRIIGTTNNHVL